ncbi:MAG: uracil-DNA glycosylase [Pseudomonadota bacterium]
MQLNEQRRLAYLDAIGVDVWLPRGDVEASTAPSAGGEAGDAAVGAMDWQELRVCVANCTLCELANTRTQTVFGVGDPDARWMVVGEAPGAEEDRRGEPFVGRAGMLLDELLRAVGQSRDTVFIANTLKCRPPNNRDPRVEESSACRPYLERQIELVQPDVILAVGRVAAQNLLESDLPVGRLRGRQHDLDGIPLIVTYHPAYLLRSPTQKRKVWQDLCLARSVRREATA